MNTSPFAFAPETALQTFIQRVYQWMAAGLALTGFVAFWVSGNLELMKMLSGPVFFILLFAELGLVFWLSASIHKMSSQTAILAFLGYAFLNGLTISMIFLIYTGASIAMTFLITAGTFATVSLFGWTTKTDLTSIRGFLFMGLIGLIIASLVNIFFQSTMFDLILSYLGVGIFIGLTAYDTQQLKQIHYSGRGDGAGNLAIMGALKLYLDFINMFLYLLRIFGRRR